MSRALCSPSTEPPAPKGPQALASSLNTALSKKACCPHQPQAARLLLFVWEIISQYFGAERVAVSLRAFFRKLCPTLDADSGMRFPKGACLGNRIPESSQIMVPSFRLTSRRSRVPFRVLRLGRGFPMRVESCDPKSNRDCTAPLDNQRSCWQTHQAAQPLTDMQFVAQ